MTDLDAFADRNLAALEEHRPDLLRRLLETEPDSRFRMEPHGEWYRATTPRPAGEHRIPNNVDLLYFRNLDGVASFGSAPRMLRAAMLAELWGFPSYALEILALAADRHPEEAETAEALGAQVEAHLAHLPADVGERRVAFPPLG